ncbi:MAG TPA: hypothetical protein VMB02_05135 [Candidatus Aquilonibacter sp.]|nr:hypothetical protein [Candidatus Aquilonibacter sp.]
MLKKLAIVAALAAASIPAQAQSCTRENLKTFVADYFKAVQTHDMSGLPTAANLRITENGQVIQPGDGFVKSGGAVHLERDLIDTERCGTLSEAVTDETVNGAQTLAIVAVRLKVDDGKVSEIETLVTREAEMKRFYNPQELLSTKDQDWTTPLPSDKRLTREYMNKGANQYFDAFVKDPTVLPPFAARCDRWEGGTHTTPTGNCSPKGLVLTHTHRRFPVTDLELGETAGFIDFGGGLPDVHIFKYNADGQLYLINAVFGGRQTGAIWPDETDDKK